jgi:hypothetical protein
MNQPPIERKELLKTVLKNEYLHLPMCAKFDSSQDSNRDDISILAQS